MIGQQSTRPQLNLVDDLSRLHQTHRTDVRKDRNAH